MASPDLPPPPLRLDTPLAECDDDDTPFQKHRTAPPFTPQPPQLSGLAAGCEEFDSPLPKFRKPPPKSASGAAGCEEFDSPLPKFRKPPPKSASGAAAPHTPSPGPDLKRRDLHDNSPGSARPGDSRSPSEEDSVVSSPGSAQSGDFRPPVKTRRDLRLACKLLENEAKEDEDGASQEGTGPSSDDKEESDDSAVTHGFLPRYGVWVETFCNIVFCANSHCRFVFRWR